MGRLHSGDRLSRALYADRTKRFGFRRAESPGDRRARLAVLRGEAAEGEAGRLLTASGESSEGSNPSLSADDGAAR